MSDVPGLDAYEREQERYEVGLERMVAQIHDAILGALNCGLSASTAYEEAIEAVSGALKGYPH